MRRWSTLAALVLAGGLALSCGDGNPSEPEPPPPVPGWLKVRLTSPHTDDGGVLFALSGGPVDSVRTSYPDLLRSEGLASPTRILVAGDLTSGSVVVEILVSDVQKVADYVAVLEQVASRATFEQRALAGYGLVVQR